MLGTVHMERLATSVFPAACPSMHKLATARMCGVLDNSLAMRPLARQLRS